MKALPAEMGSNTVELPRMEIPALSEWHEPLDFETLPVADGRVLVVDDTPSACRALAAVVIGMGVGTVVTATTGREALRLLLDRDFDLILLDVHMPEMDGFETARLIRGRPRTAQVPIIFVTAVVRTEAGRAQGYSLGAVDYITVPVAAEVLRAKVKVFLSLHRATRQLKAWAEDLVRFSEDLSRANAELKEQGERLNAANQELEAFSYTVSHDLRAPLRAMKGFAEMLEEHAVGVLGAEGLRLLQVVRENAERMDRLIVDLLTFSRASRQEIRVKVVDMEGLARAVIDELRQADQSRAVEVSIAPLLRVRGDSAMLRQVWSNLLGNAWKFSRGRAPARIEVGGREEGGELLYWVKDNGAGFDMKRADRLFGVFRRLHSGKEFEGEGAGLAIARRIVLRHGGRIWGEGKVDAGATFWFALPSGTRNTVTPPMGADETAAPAA